MGTTPKRAQRLSARGFATKREERQHRMRARLQSAATAEQQLAAAYDWFRLTVAHDAPGPDRPRLMRDMAQHLASRARAIEGGDG